MLSRGHIETHDVRAHVGPGRDAPFDVGIGYSYQFQGEFYGGFHELGWAQSMEDGDTMCQQFPIGSEVNIRVNPDNPGQSMLDMSGGSKAISASDPTG